MRCLKHSSHYLKKSGPGLDVHCYIGATLSYEASYEELRHADFKDTFRIIASNFIICLFYLHGLHYDNSNYHISTTFPYFVIAYFSRECQNLFLEHEIESRPILLDLPLGASRCQ